MVDMLEFDDSHPTQMIISSHSPTFFILLRLIRAQHLRRAGEGVRPQAGGDKRRAAFFQRD